MLCLWAIPYGLGAGAVDAALNNYVALHYASRHMNWLHCFWGVGAAVSPYIMSWALTGQMGWESGYRIVGIIQIVLTAILFFSLPLWTKRKNALAEEKHSAPALSLPQIFRIRGVPYILLAFLGYCALETTTGLWASSYLVLGRGISTEVAARYASLFYLGITAGRFLSGFVSNRLGDRKMIRIGLAVMLVGLAALWVPLAADWLCLAGLAVIGLGCAPITLPSSTPPPATSGAKIPRPSWACRWPAPMWAPPSCPRCSGSSRGISASASTRPSCCVSRYSR